MTNCEMHVEGDVLTIKIDLTRRFDQSKSGKSIVVATTGGNISVPEHMNLRIGINCYEKK